MKCEAVRDELEAFNAGELPQNEAAQLARHLAECPSCEIEREELLGLAAELRHVGEAFRPVQPFDVPAATATVRRRRTGLLAAGTAAGIWMLLVTTAAVWPSFAERLTFLPIGRELAQTTNAPRRDSRTSSAVAGSHSLVDVPGAALTAVAALFGPSPEMRALSHDGMSAELARLLPGRLGGESASVRLIAVGPVVGMNQGEVRLIATVSITPKTPNGIEKALTSRLLISVKRSAAKNWHVSRIATPSGP